MEDPAEIVSGLFALAVTLVIIAILISIPKGYEISPILAIVSNWAVPFTIFLIVVFFILEFWRL